MKIKHYFFFFLLPVALIQAWEGQSDYEKLMQDLEITGSLQECVFSAGLPYQYRWLDENGSGLTVLRSGRGSCTEEMFRSRFMGRSRFYALKDCINIINKYGQENRLNALSELVLMQVNMALFIARRIKFPGEADMHAFSEYPEHINDLFFDYKPSQYGKMQWIFLLLFAKEMINDSKDEPLAARIGIFEKSINMIDYFLGDIGFVGNRSEDDEAAITLDDLIKNFILLFDHVDVVKNLPGRFSEGLVRTFKDLGAENLMKMIGVLQQLKAQAKDPNGEELKKELQKITNSTDLIQYIKIRMKDA